MAVATAVSPGPAVVESTDEAAPAQITSRVFARIGLLGNPSDGYHGKTISFALANFYAEVSICFQHTATALL
jgi:glucuronokinase